MPNFIHKNFINIYDELQRLELRPKLSTREFQDLPTGLILSQSLPPGKIAFAHDNIHFVINQPHPFLDMPDLRNTSLESAKSLLERLPGNGKVYPLKLVSVANIVTSAFPNNSVIAQFPLPGDKVNSNEKVYLLVALREETKENLQENKKIKSEINSEGSDTPGADKPKQKETKGPQTFLERKDWIGKNIAIASQYFHYNKIDYRIKKLIPPDNQNNEMGLIKSVEMGANGQWLLEVYYQEKENKLYSSFETAHITLDEKGSCVVTLDFLETKGLDAIGQQIIFSTQRHKEDEELTLVFYRQGPVKVEGRCGGTRVYKKKFYPDHLG